MAGERSVLLRGRPWIPPTGAARALGAILLGLLLVAALTVAARRLAGALQEPLVPSVALIVGVCLAVLATAIRVMWFLPAGSALTRQFDGLVMSAVSLSCLLLLGSLNLPSATLQEKILLCSILLLEETAAWARFVQRSKAGLVGDEVRVSSPGPRREIGDAEATHGAMATGTMVCDISPEEEITQQLTRTQSDEGVETISGWFRAFFAPGQRTAMVHVAFCPAFAQTPSVEAEQSDGPDARIKVAQAAPYGVRFDLKLSTVSAEPSEASIHFSASAPLHPCSESVE